MALWVQVALIAGLVVVSYGTFSFLRNRGFIRNKESPESVISLKGQLSMLEGGENGFDENQPLMPLARIESYSPEEGYLLVFEEPAKWLGNREERASIWARHTGYPVSLLAKRVHPAIFVSGEFGSGERFIARLQLFKE